MNKLGKLTAACFATIMSSGLVSAQYGAPVPEMNTFGIILVIIIAVAGLLVVVRKQEASNKKSKKKK